MKNSSSLFLLISSLQRSLTLLALFVTFQKIACLHVCFTAYENFYRLSKNALCSRFFPLSLHQKYQKSETQQSNMYPLIHWFSIYGSSLSGDLLSIIMPFCITRAYTNVNQHTSQLNLSPTVCLSVLT